MSDYKIKEISSEDWKPTAKGIPGIFIYSIMPSEWSEVKMLLTKVEAKGIFPQHKDDYHHVFHFIEGEGIVMIGDEKHEIKKNLIVHIPAGLLHSYENTGSSELILLTVNIPKKEK
ncbi:MAG TPA: cupin domain-containing protein [candidate division Zixibacteria bacterium]|nr:cupin domain-containing protein [candidate division Zixibacteria bacterium]